VAVPAPHPWRTEGEGLDEVARRALLAFISLPHRHFCNSSPVFWAAFRINKPPALQAKAGENGSSFEEIFEETEEELGAPCPLGQGLFWISPKKWCV
jgi:hypothetical protein